ncbi:hypothetical protein [Shewanella surugensis]|uniref:Uncharacterized protein n=1 Tax=Shewanella surugensis TaxID=212020 RepID=A0ABT0L9T0_9GAMM|nr:hypothetical protein [Shewanella surugensis]MCL1124107.1 hypothetical protein [Shewanella surugensis]
MYRLDDFYDLSATLTDYPVTRLIGTGVGNEYNQTLSQWVRQDVLDELYHCFSQLERNNDGQVCPQALRHQLLSNEKYGPIARNIIKMWYLSIWYKMTDNWSMTYGIPAYSSPVIGVESPTPEDYIISNNAYIQGLVWPLMGSHPMGAKQPGYGTWSDAPLNSIASIHLQ